MTTEESIVWGPPEQISLPEWAERYRVLPRRGHAEPGVYRIDRTPYVREILECLGDDVHEEVAFCASSQVGKSEVGRCAIGYWIDYHGDDILMSLPNEKSAKEHLEDQIQPMLREPRLARWKTDRGYDITRELIRLRNCTVYLAWSGSVNSLASRAIRFGISDEVDKARDTGKEAPPLDLIRARFTTFGRRAKHLIVSTPTVKDGPIWTTWLTTADRRRWHVPCPHCGVEQALEWERVRWEGSEVTDLEELPRVIDQLLVGDYSAWYECEHCDARIQERDRLRAVEAGRWVSCLGDAPRSIRVAFHISALYSPWVSFARVVSEYLKGRCRDDMRHFRNAILGLPHEDRAISVSRAALEARTDAPAFLVPEWATCVTAGADTQARAGMPYWVYVVRAWGKGYRSRLLTWGRAYSAAQLRQLTLGQAFCVEGQSWKIYPVILTVDSGGGAELVDGNTTEAVYRLAELDPARIVPVKGYGGRVRPDQKIRSKRTVYTPPQGGKPPVEVMLHTLDAEHFQDLLARLIAEIDPVMWEESACVTPEYIAQMSTMEKTRVRLGGTYRVRWRNPTRKRVDLWDASVYALAAAHMVRADQRHEAAVLREQRHDQAAAQRAQPKKRSRYGARRGVGPWIRRRDK